MNTKRWMVLGLLAVSAVSAVAAEAKKEGVALTVYNGGYGVVRETRSVEIAPGGLVKFRDVASGIDATTVHFKSLTDPAAKLLEQNYQYDLVSADKLLKKYVDRRIEVICSDKKYAGRLLSFDGSQLVLQEAKGGVIMVQRPDNVRDIRFSAMPGGLLVQPTLLWLVATKRPGKHLAEVTYQTRGLNWHAEYVLVLDAADTAADLSGWISVQNTSGKTYGNAKLKFIAGDVRKIWSQRISERGEQGLRMKRGATVTEKAFFEYHMYTLGRRSTVADNEVKQLEMFPPARGVTVEKKFVYNPLSGYRWQSGRRYDDRGYGVTSHKKVTVLIEFVNTAKNRLGIPLPAGKVRVYKKDADDGALEFIGEERIDHTPTDERLSLRIGNAFDVVGERKQTHFQIETGRKWMREDIEIKIRNHKKQPVVVRCKEPLYRWVNAKITKESRKHTTLDSHTVAYDVKVEPKKEVTVTYSVEYTW